VEHESERATIQEKRIKVAALDRNYADHIKHASHISAGSGEN
jgi:hypothetical protein